MGSMLADAQEIRTIQKQVTDLAVADLGDLFRLVRGMPPEAARNLLLDTVEELELIGPLVAPTELLVRLFHEEQPRIFDAQLVRFGCTCSAEKVEAAMSIYSAKDIRHMTNPEGIVTADCQFCGAHYEFDPKTLGFEAEKAGGDDG